MKSVCRKLKIFWFGCCLTLTLVPCIGFFQYLIDVHGNISDKRGFFQICTVSLVSVLIFLVLPLITYRYREKFQAILEYLEEQIPMDSVQRNKKSDVFLNRRNTMREISVWLLFTLVVCIPFTTGGFIDVLFFCPKQDSFRDMNHHILTLPHIQRISSMSTAVSVYLLEISILSVLQLIAFSTVYFIIMVADEFNNVMVNYCGRIVAINKSIASARGAWSNNFFQRSMALLLTQYQTFIK